MQTGTRRTMPLCRRMLFQHLYCNCNDADRRQTACLQNNAKNQCANTKIAFPSQRVSPSRLADLHGLVNRAQLPQSSVQRKQQQKQPKTKTVVIETQCQKPLTPQKLTSRFTTPALNQNDPVLISPSRTYMATITPAVEN